ncbi:MAG TPA: M28 family peptidase [Solirubrobacterales bacterium]|nr:M28 family peptidase [Solirubrobacterales bacterium]
MGSRQGTKRRWAMGLLVMAVVALPVGCGSSSSSETTAAESPPAFDEQAAYELVELQVEAGQRPAGSPQLRKLANQLVKLLPRGEFEPIPGEPQLRNIVGSIPGDKPAIVIGAHYDTLSKPKGFVGANNGAAGTAAVIEVAQALESAASPEGREIKFVLFDGEEPPGAIPETAAEFYRQGLRGSRAYVAAHPDETEAMILLDYVGHKGLKLTREESSTPWLWQRLVEASEKVGASRYFSNEKSGAILDDHAPFLRAGVPAIDLIDWRYPGQTLADGLDKISVQSLEAVGDTVAQLAAELRAE